jgi:hypothetical protein
VRVSNVFLKRSRDDQPSCIADRYSDRNQLPTPMIVATRNRDFAAVKASTPRDRADQKSLKQLENRRLVYLRSLPLS